MKSLDEQVVSYAAYHRDPRNKLTHFFGVPLVTFALFAMCGLMGLAVDLGWSFYVHKTARAAADSAALAAVKEALAQTVGTPGSVSCTTAGITCSGLIDCSAATGTLQVACQYAQQNGFSSGSRMTVHVRSPLVFVSVTVAPAAVSRSISASRSSARKSR